MKDSPVFNKCKGRLIDKAGSSTNILISGNCFTTVDNNTYVYTNQQSFSHIGIDVETTYTKLDVPNYPPAGFVRNYRVGVIHNAASYRLIGTDGSLIDSGDIVCDSEADKTKPSEALMCEQDLVFPTGVTHGQILEIKVTSETGGFKEIRRDGSASEYDTRFFNGQPESVFTAFFFDLIPPEHCTKNDNCPHLLPPLDIYRDVTKQAEVSAEFFGWNDVDSFINKNVIKVYTTFLGTDGYLHESAAPIETYTHTIHQNDSRYNLILPSPGVFSFIGEVHDIAGNIALVRSTVLFDDTSSVESTDTPFKVTRATRLGDTFWLNSNADVIVSWEGCFENRFLHENGLLAPMDPSFSGLHSNFGNRTEDDLAVILGISNFYYKLASTIEPPDIINADWMKVDPLADNVSIALPSLNSGNGNTLHVRAEDILQNALTKRIYIRLDGTAPLFSGTPKFEHSIPNEKAGFFSSVDIQVEDEESGILRIDFQLLDVALDDAVISVDSQEGQMITKSSQQNSRISRSVCSGDDTCYCTLDDAVEECYNSVQRVYINNCWLVRHVGEGVKLNATVYNQAQQSTLVTYNLGQIPQLEGIDYYPAVDRLIVEQTFGYGAIIQWALPVSCYSIMSIEVAVSGGIEQKLVLTADAQEAEIVDLIPVRDYIITVTIIYSSFQNGDPAEMTFNTGQADYNPNAVTTGAIVGIVIGSLVGAGVIAIGIVIALRVRAKKPPLPTRLNTIRNNISNRFSRMVGRGHADRGGPSHLTENMMYFEGDEDEVYYCDNKKTGWKLPASKVQLGDLIAQGKFAVIHRGVLEAKNGAQEIAVKMLQDPTEQNKLLLQSKMNFLATAVKVHPNLVNFMGGVEEGPMLLLELCDQPLKTWLQDVTEVDAPVVDQMYLFSVHVARALQHLHDNKIIHRRLGLRNVLIKSEFGRFVAKVTGFGPMKNPKDEATLPIKWMAPEQLGKGKGKARSYTEKTDVWSFAVTIWEIFSKGGVPYPKMRSSDLKDQLDAGVRLEIPDNCSDEIYENVMKPSWHKDPTARPQVHILRKHLESFVTGSTDQEYYADESGSSGYGANYMYDDTRPT